MKILIFLLILTLSISSFAQDKLKAGLFNITPYAFKKNDEIIGITPEIIKKLEDKSGIKIETVLVPYKRMLKYLELGEIDFAIFFLTDYSKSFSESLIPLYSLDTIVLGNKHLYISNINDLYYLRLATASGVKYNIKELKKPLRIHYVKNYKDALLMLKVKRIDAIIGPKKILEYRAKELGLKNEDFNTPFVLTKNTAWIQFSNHSLKHQYKLKLIKAAQELLKEKEINKIIDKYYLKD